MHFLIPETVAGYDFGKGPYYESYGDFTTAGYVAYNTINVPEKNMVKIEGGQFNTARAVALINLLGEKAKQKKQSAYIAGEALYSDGPFNYGEHFNRFNLFGKFITPVSTNTKLIFSASTLSSTWRALRGRNSKTELLPKDIFLTIALVLLTARKAVIQVA